MATEWKSQICNDEGKYYLQFETDDKEKYKFIEKAAQLCMDGHENITYLAQLDSLVILIKSK